ncbi:MAG: ABC transporter ATP-binding protein [Methanospirillum sp.]|uniref:ABC transporter ATP-binding protein n=1 Tax=Methanospirillum sp. TaxID=45200 RepID=UPI002370E687|nr:ABC transporter ATP-binding protein [Methanospirillum sp.]MDD1729335.1 ABC transporter ATP-binding protein [Methanospirillum sp.]
MNLLEVQNLTKIYRRGSEEIHALKGVSLTARAGEFISIVGPSGSGKTALMNLIGSLDTPDGGTILIDGKEISGLPERERVSLRRHTIGFVFQQFFLIPTMTARENIMLPLIFSRQKIDEAWIEQILAMVGLTERAGHKPHELSGGEMQRVAIGRALVNRPEIILADEPTGNLDSATAEQIYVIFEELTRQGITLIVVTHNPDLARRSHRIVTICDGIIHDESSTGTDDS